MNALHRDLKRLVALVEQQGAAKAAADPYRQHYHLQPTVGWLNDPKVFAFEGRYYMMLGARTLEDKGEVLVLESTDKLHWTHINTLTTPEPFGYMWECPDLFCIDRQWYLAVSPQGIPCQNAYGCGWFAVQGDWRGEYQLGAFHPLDAGFDSYAPQSFADDGRRRIQISWMGMPDAGCRLRQRPHGSTGLAALHDPAPAADPGSGRRIFADPGGAARSGSAAVPYPRAGTGRRPPLCPDGAAGGRLCSHHCQGGRAGVY